VAKNDAPKKLPFTFDPWHLRRGQTEKAPPETPTSEKISRISARVCRQPFPRQGRPPKIEGQKLGQIVSVKPNEISDWLYVDNGKPVRRQYCSILFRFTITSFLPSRSRSYTVRRILRSKSHDAGNSERPAGADDENKKSFDHRSCGDNSAVRRMRR
jgi:hypothetical protein